ncbi:DUF6538 domain-containing protein [Tritonibacter scottomollicae]|uniref:DUF6538 domain-containing protein n=1 Tax=Tritonibacter scottomollicae TaxID=483013 RepID=UPI003AA83EC0
MSHSTVAKFLKCRSIVSIPGGRILATTLYLLQRGSTWSWRRRVPEFSTKNRHWQLPLRTTDRSIARIIARRLNYQCDRMLDAITDGKLPPSRPRPG